MKAELLDRHRDINVSWDHWWEDIQEEFKRRMYLRGIAADEIMFSGFWSQGDGASFTGEVDDMATFLSKFIERDAYPMIRKLRDMGGGVYVRFSRHSCAHYVHENTVYADVTGDYFCDVFHEGVSDFRAVVIDAWEELLAQEYADFEAEATEILRDLCRELYSRLEQEYDYLTSDEAVWETIQANELDEEEDSDNEETGEVCCGALQQAS